MNSFSIFIPRFAILNDSYKYILKLYNILRNVQFTANTAVVDI